MLLKAVITGASGMIGSNLIKVLLKENFEVVAIVRPNSKKKDNIPKDKNVKIVECDLSNLNSLSFKLTNCDMFFHFGWSGTFGSTRDDVYRQLNNIQYTLDAVRLAKSIGCTSFVGAGSQAEYGFSDEKLSSNTSTNPVTGYGIAKYAAGKLSRILANELGIKHCWTRILSVYGPGDNENTMISSCIGSILNDKPFDTTKGDQLWDYIYSEDCARAFYLIAKNGINNQVYPIGSGKAIPLKEYIKTIKDSINPEFNIGFGNRDYSPNQVMHLCADISNLTEDTGFKPETNFKEGIKKTIEWVKIKDME